MKHKLVKNISSSLPKYRLSLIVWVNTILNRTVVKLLTVTDTLTLKMTSVQVVET